MATIEKRETESGVSYRVKVRLRGFAPESASFERLTDAKEWAKKIESDMKAGRHFGISKRHTLAELITRYESAELPKLKSAASVKPRLAWWKEEHGERLLSDLTPEVIATSRDKLKATPKQRGGGQRSNADVNRALALLSCVCSYGVTELGWLERNPLERVRKTPEAKGRVRFLTDDELIPFLHACLESKNPDLYVAVVLSLTTGARQSEVLSLRWSQIDFKRRVAMLGDTKNGDARALPLSGEAFELLKNRSKVRSLKDDRIFPSKPGSKAPFVELRAPFQAALKEAKITNFRWHDLRHTAASYLAMDGTSPLEIAKVLGHRTMAMVARYSHLAPGRVVELGDALAKRLGV